MRRKRSHRRVGEVFSGAPQLLCHASALIEDPANEQNTKYCHLEGKNALTLTKLKLSGNAGPVSLPPVL